jgi:hypothetical protein
MQSVHEYCIQGNLGRVSSQARFEYQCQYHHHLDHCFPACNLGVSEEVQRPGTGGTEDP